MAGIIIPSPETTREFRSALGCFATGVTIVTTQTASGPLGMTANSFSSLSMTPPLVMWAPAKSSLRYPHFVEAKHFAIHVLHEGQQDLALAFARQGDAFDPTIWQANAQNVPVIADCLARFECSAHAVHDGGDHSIIVGKVTQLVMNSGRPLVFAQGQYREITDTL